MSSPSPESGYLLEVQHVAKSYGRHLVLKDVSFRVGEGEIVGIVGENGVGKSTLLKILVGWFPPNAGQVSLRGEVGYCPQEALCFENLTVEENFRYFATAYGLQEKGTVTSWQKTMQDLLERFNFSQYRDMRVANLSGGTRQKLNLSLALLHAPSLLILDEPYSGFDWETYLHFWDYATELRARKNGILIVSHLVYDQSKFDALYELEGGMLG